MVSSLFTWYQDILSLCSICLFIKSLHMNFISVCDKTYVLWKKIKCVCRYIINIIMIKYQMGVLTVFYFLHSSKSPVGSSMLGSRSPGAAPLSPRTLGGSCPPLNHPALKHESDSDEADNLVVDENPPAKKASRDSVGKLKASLKLKLSSK